MRLSTLVFATAIAVAGAVTVAPRAARADDLTAMSRQLKLSPDQEKKVREIQDNLHKSTARTRAAIEVSSIDLRRELEKDKPDEKKAGRFVDDIARLEGEARKQRIFAMLRIKKLLTSEQRKELEKMGPIATGPVPAPMPAPGPTWHNSPAPPAVAGDDDDDDSGFDPGNFNFNIDPGDFDIDVNVDGVELSAEVRKEIEQAKIEAKRARKEALKAAKEARVEAMRSARDAMREAEQARRDAMREAKRAFEEARRSGQLKGGSFTVTTHQKNGASKGPSQVVIEAQPYAEIYVDGKKRGNTPLKLSLSRGRHTVEARWNGKSRKTVVNISGGDMVVLSFQQGN